MLNLNLTPIRGNHNSSPPPAEAVQRPIMVATNGSGQPQSTVGRVMKLLTGACLLTSVAAGRALQAPIGAQNSNFLLQNGRRTLTDGQGLAQFRQDLRLSTTAGLPLEQTAGRTLAAHSKGKKMTKIHHKKPTHHTPSTPGAKHKAKPAPSSAPKKPPQTAPGNNYGLGANLNSRQKVLVQIRNEYGAANLSTETDMSKSLPVIHSIIKQASSVLDAEVKDLSLKKSPNGPQMLGTNDLNILSSLMDQVNYAIGYELNSHTPHTQQQLTDVRAAIMALQDIKIKAEEIVFP